MSPSTARSRATAVECSAARKPTACRTAACPNTNSGEGVKTSPGSYARDGTSAVWRQGVGRGWHAGCAGYEVLSERLTEPYASESSAGCSTSAFYRTGRGGVQGPPESTRKYLRMSPGGYAAAAHSDCGAACPSRFANGLAGRGTTARSILGTGSAAGADSSGPGYTASFPLLGDLFNKTIQQKDVPNIGIAGL